MYDIHVIVILRIYKFMLYSFIILDNVLTVTGIVFFNMTCEYYLNDNFLKFFEKIVLIYNMIFYNIISFLLRGH